MPRKHEPSKEKAEKRVFQTDLDLCGGRYCVGNGLHFYHGLENQRSFPIGLSDPRCLYWIGGWNRVLLFQAKAENRIKLRKMYGPEIYNDTKEM